MHKAASVSLNLQKDSAPLSKPDIETLKSNTDWKPSPKFKSGDHFWTGVKGKFALFTPKPLTSEMGNKVLFAYWGDQEERDNHTFSIAAIHKQSDKAEKVLIEGTDTDHPVWSYNSGFSIPSSGGDGSLPAGLSFSKPGIWCLNGFLDGKFIGQIIVKVKE